MEDDYVAFCLDQATAYWGRCIQYELDSVDEKDPREADRKRLMVLEKFLDEPTAAPKPGRFADPALMM